jgi:hypothetical protein
LTLVFMDPFTNSFNIRSTAKTSELLMFLSNSALQHIHKSFKYPT